VVSGLVYEPLVECRSDRYQPALAERWETSPDGLRLMLHLRADARWHDGRAVSPVDAQASLEPLLRASSRQPALRALLSDVEAVEVLPDRIVRLRLVRPSQLVLRALCEVPILPADLLRGSPSQVALLGRAPVGTGPFRFAAWERGKRIRLTRRVPREAGGPFLDEIVFEIENDGARALSRTRRGELDILPRVLDIHYPDQVAPGALRESLRLYRLTPERYSFLVVNHRRPLLADVRVRRALALLWNRERLAEEVHRGLARPIAAPPFGAVPPLAFDRPAAERLLEEAGHRDGNGDGVRDRDGAPIRLTMLQVAGPRAAAEGRAFAHELRRAGLLLDVVTVDPSTLLARLKKGDFDLAPMVWEGRPDDDPRALFGAQGELAFGGHRSEAVEALLDELRAADGPRGRAPLLQRIAQTLAEEQPVIFLYRHDLPALVSKRVHGLSGSGDRLDLRSVWVEP
jgi:peptide/nickel transport system substrate-binding protein